MELPSPLPQDFTKKWQESLTRPLQAGDKLFDSQQNGWLVWGKSLPGYEPPPQDASPFVLEEESKAALESMAEVLATQAWWDNHARHLAQEYTRDFLAADNTMFMKVRV